MATGNSSAASEPAKAGRPAPAAARKAAPAKATPSAAPDPDESADGQVAAGDAAAADATGEGEAFLNRAERRAKGRGKSAAAPPARGKVAGGAGPAHTQRMWANRRSG